MGVHIAARRLDRVIFKGAAMEALAALGAGERAAMSPAGPGPSLAGVLQSRARFRTIDYPGQQQTGKDETSRDHHTMQ